MPHIFDFVQKDGTTPRCWQHLAEHKLPAAQAVPVSTLILTLPQPTRARPATWHPKLEPLFPC